MTARLATIAPKDFANLSRTSVGVTATVMKTSAALKRVMVTGEGSVGPYENQVPGALYR